MNGDNIQSNAIEELKILSSIIGRIESAIYQKQGWLFTLITGLTLALLKDNPLILKEKYAIISISITIVFYIADIIQRVPVHRAIRRSRQIESFLAGSQNDYNGPLISESLGQGEGINDYIGLLLRFRVWAPYVGIIIMVLIIYLIAPLQVA